MSRIRAQTTAIITAPPAAVWSIIADYRQGHPSILPPRYFAGLDVEEGGVGEGTVFRVHMRVLGSIRTMRMRVSEPEPGRVLEEADLDSDMVTRFTLDPLDDGRTSVTIATTWLPRPGVSGLIDRAVTPSLMRLVYSAELAQLEAVCRRAGPLPAA